VGEIIFLAIVALIGGAAFLMTSSFRTSILDRSGGPGMFPRIVVILLMFVIVIRVVQIIARKETQNKFHFVEMFKGIRLLYVLVTLAYMLTLKRLGYLVATIPYLVFAVLFYRAREVDDRLKPWTAVAIVALNVALVIGVYFFFTQVVNIRLPAGLLKGVI